MPALNVFATLGHWYAGVRMGQKMSDQQKKIVHAMVKTDATTTAYDPVLYVAHQASLEKAIKAFEHHLEALEATKGWTLWCRAGQERLARAEMILGSSWIPAGRMGTAYEWMKRGLEREKRLPHRKASHRSAIDDVKRSSEIVLWYASWTDASMVPPTARQDAERKMLQRVLLGHPNDQIDAVVRMDLARIAWTKGDMVEATGHLAEAQALAQKMLGNSMKNFLDNELIPLHARVEQALPLGKDSRAWQAFAQPLWNRLAMGFATVNGSATHRSRPATMR